MPRTCSPSLTAERPAPNGAPAGWARRDSSKRAIWAGRRLSYARRIDPQRTMPWADLHPLIDERIRQELDAARKRLAEDPADERAREWAEVLEDLLTVPDGVVLGQL